MKRIKEDLLKIFYFPLVILAFSLVLGSSLSFLSFFQEKSGLALGDGSFDYQKRRAVFQNRQVPVPVPQITRKTDLPTVLSAASGEKWIEVNLTTQTLTAYEPDGGIFMQVPVSTGLWAPTPTGTFRIWIKLRYALMRGGSKAAGTYYYLPNVPCTQYFYKGYGLHGTYWHNNFGQPMSHGCVNMATPDACRLFEWTSPPIAPNVNVVNPSSSNRGTQVRVHY